MKRVPITNVGEDEYGTVDSWDEVVPGLGRSIVIEPGETVYVTEKKAAQIADDFPGWLEVGRVEEVPDEPASTGVELREAFPVSDEIAVAVKPRRSRKKEEATADAA